MDQTEFSTRIEKNRPKLMKIAKSMVRNCDYEDAVQSAVLSAWEHLPQLRDEASFDAWLAQILINRCRQIQRSYKKNMDAYAALVQLHEREETGTDLSEAMEELSDEERALIHLHYHQGYTLREISAMKGQTQAAMKMRLYRARNHLRVILITLLLLVLLTCAAIGTGMIDVNWFLQNRRAEPGAIHHSFVPEMMEISYSGDMLAVEISDAVWNRDDLSVTFVYSIAGKDEGALIVHGGNIGVDGVRHHHIWTNDGIVPVEQWADGKPVQVFRIDGWRLGGAYLTEKEDFLPDGRGETFMAEIYLEGIRPERYESLLDEDNMLTFEADLMLKEYAGGAVLEEGKIVLRIDAPAVQVWREMYEAFYR